MKMTKTEVRSQKSELPKARLLLVGLAATALSGPAGAQQQEPMGRLFFTPAQRSSLDVARSQRARTTLGTERTEEQAVPQEQTITYGGMVRRSDGKSTVWINGRPVTEQEGVGGGATVVGRVGADGSVSLQNPQSGRSVSLKPGQSLELLSGAIEEGYSRKPVVVPETKPTAKPEQRAETGKADASKGGRELSEREQEQLKEALARALEDAAASKPVPPAAPAIHPRKP
jgi:hypothetical protein